MTTADTLFFLCEPLTQLNQLDQYERLLFGKDYKCTFFLLQVLKKEFPKGVDIIYESVGGEMFDRCLNALAIYGRLVVIGMISQVNPFLVF